MKDFRYESDPGVENMTYRQVADMSKHQIYELNEHSNAVIADVVPDITVEDRKKLKELLMDAYFTGMRAARNFHLWENKNKK